MQNVELTFEAALGAMELLKGMNQDAVFQQLGITKEEQARVFGDAPWVAQDRPLVVKVLDACAAGVMDVTAVPRFEMPAEYMAAVIVRFVSPTNIHLACRYMESQRPVTDFMPGATSKAGTVDPSQLFALVIQLYRQEGIEKLRYPYQKAMRSAIRKNEEGAN